MVNKKDQPIEQLIPKGTKPEQLLKELHSFEGRMAEVIAVFAGSMYFVYFHAIWFGSWIVVNQGFLMPYVKPFDPYPYGLLTMLVSLEAIFLATFIMITQNRQALVDTYRELEEDEEQQQEEKEQDELEEEVEDIQKDLDDIKNAISFIQQKITGIEKVHPSNKNDGQPKAT